MQFSENSFPAIGAIKAGHLTDIITIHDPRKLFTYDQNFMVSAMFCQESDFYNKKTFYISKPVMDCIKKAEKKLMSIDMLGNVLDECGLIIYNEFQICFKIVTKNDNLLHSWFIFQKNILLAAYANRLPEEKHFSGCWIADGDFGFGSEEIEEAERINSIERFIYGVIGFLQFAKIETTEIKHGNRLFIKAVKYVNNTHSDIIYVDSLWFTTLTSSEGFNVRGHFRLQPYKDRHELIWISEFEKHGYTRIAKKLAFYTENESDLDILNIDNNEN